LDWEANNLNLNNCHIHSPVLSFLNLTCKISFILSSDPKLVSFSLYEWPITLYAVCNSIPPGKILLTALGKIMGNFCMFPKIFPFWGIFWETYKIFPKFSRDFSQCVCLGSRFFFFFYTSLCIDGSMKRLEWADASNFSWCFSSRVFRKLPKMSYEFP